jgi:hypothetical protein
MTGRASMTAAGSAAFLLATCLIACDGASVSPGPTEALQVAGGQFVPGALPGALLAAPTDGGIGDGGAPAASDGAIPPLSITQLGVPVLPLPVGAVGEAVSGYASDDTAAVGVRFADVGTGYWIVPVGATDPQYPGQITFGMRVTFAPTIPAGTHELLAVAIGASGQAGTQRQASMCFESAIPDNGHACNPAIPVPAAVISLSWDTNFDLDLHVIAPNGENFDPKTPLGFYPDSGARPPATLPAIDRDSLAGCVPDGIRREDLVFPTAPAPGAYEIYVDPFAACGQAAVRFTVTVYTAVGTCPNCALEVNTSPQVNGAPRSGEIIASQTTGGATTGLFVGQTTF